MGAGGSAPGCARPLACLPSLPRWSRPPPPQASHSASTIPQGGRQCTGAFDFSPLAARCSYCLLLPGHHRVPLLISKIEKAKISNEKEWEVKNVPCHSSGWDNKDKASCKVEQETLFLSRTSCSGKRTPAFLLTEKSCPLKSETIRNFAVWNFVSRNETPHSCLHVLIHSDTEKQLLFTTQVHRIR